MTDRPPAVEAARIALKAYREWLKATGKDPKEASAYWVDRCLRGMQDAEVQEELERRKRVIADRAHEERMRKLKDSNYK